VKYQKKASSRLRVLVVTREYPPNSEGGISRRLEKIIPRLLNRGIDVGVVSFGGKSIAGERVYSLEPKSSILYSRSREPGVSGLASVINDINRLDQYASEISKIQSYQIVHIEEPIFGPFVRTKLPKVVTVHNTQLGEARALFSIMNEIRQAKRLLFSSFLGAPLDLLCLSKAYKIVAISPHVKSQIVSQYRIPPSRIEIIPNGIDPPTKRDAAIKIRKTEGLTLTYVGRLVDHKRVDVFLTALAILKLRGVDKFKAFIVGTGPSGPALKSIAKRLSLEDKVSFTGYINDSDLGNILLESDVFVFPSVYEGWGLSIYEAASYGCAPVVSNIPVFSDYLTDQRNVLLFEPGNPAALAEKLLALEKDRSLLSSIQTEAQRLVERFSWDASADKLVELYSKLV
jgi:glycogen(starch) synthase